jgi:hypothetical protein
MNGEDRRKASIQMLQADECAMRAGFQPDVSLTGMSTV